MGIIETSCARKGWPVSLKTHRNRITAMQLSIALSILYPDKEKYLRNKKR